MNDTQTLDIGTGTPPTEYCKTDYFLPIILGLIILGLLIKIRSDKTFI